jgi:DeoR/GlpR family transcriptional regulator of sugar metabolism
MVNAFENALFPRRSQLLSVIRENGVMNFDQIRRNFMIVNGRTLRYDLKKLQDGGFIYKLGRTKGVFYKPAPQD